MKNPFTVTDLIVISHPFIFGMLSLAVLCGVLVVVVKCSRSMRILAVVLAALYALLIGWRAKVETWLGASMLHFAIEDQKYAETHITGTETNKVRPAGQTINSK